MSSTASPDGLTSRLRGGARRRIEDFRRTRSQAREASALTREVEELASPMRVAAITVARDEALMLPVWLRYYGDQLGPENLYVIDDNSVDGSTEHLPCDVIHIPPVRGGKFESTRMRLASGLADALLAVYDAVLFVDVDEFVVADPDTYSGLVDFAASHRERKSVGAHAYEVIHHIEEESPLDLTRPILGQRTFATFAPVMCKPSLTFTASRWVAASHGTTVPYEVDPGLWMFHMKFADRDLLRHTAEHRQAMVRLDGRSAQTNWKAGSEPLVARLEEAQANIDLLSAREHEQPSPEKLATLVQRMPTGAYRSPKGPQVRAIPTNPVMRIPARFHGLV